MSNYQDAAFLKGEAAFAGGVMRWKSNNRVPFDDVLRAAKAGGLPVDIERSRQARNADTAAILAEYRQARASETDAERAEHRAELRAAFGPGAVVVDVVTGERVRA